MGSEPFHQGTAFEKDRLLASGPDPLGSEQFRRNDLLGGADAGFGGQWLHEIHSRLAKAAHSATHRHVCRRQHAQPRTAEVKDFSKISFLKVHARPPFLEADIREDIPWYSAEGGQVEHRQTKPNSENQNLDSRCDRGAFAHLVWHRLQPVCRIARF